MSNSLMNLSPEQIEDLIDRWERMEKECSAGTGDMYGAELAYNSKQAITQLQSQNQNYKEQIKELVKQKYRGEE